ncbi:MAG: hypothetical protein JRC87_06165 [Deltaproteobacteria bacterium]|nr:hypothetical protein [Deltaproteobacteria bacterium]
METAFGYDREKTKQSAGRDLRENVYRSGGGWQDLTQALKFRIFSDIYVQGLR